jgi:hypothetical protein
MSSVKNATLAASATNFIIPLASEAHAALKRVGFKNIFLSARVLRIQLTVPVSMHFQMFSLFRCLLGNFSDASSFCPSI